MNSDFFSKAKQIFKTVSYILSWTLFGILIIIIGLLVYYLACTNLYAKNGEKFAPPFSLYTIVSPSMEPTINVYDVIITKNTPAEDIKQGDVITFISTSSISNGMTVTHRVVGVLEGTAGLEFKTKGDNNISADTDTAKSQNLLGKVVFKIPQLGRLQFFLSSKGGWLLVILFPALFIIVNDIFKILKLNEAKKKVTKAEKNGLNDEKIKLESFRKEEIKGRLDKKNLEKGNKLKEDIINNKINKKEEKIGFIDRIAKAYEKSTDIYVRDDQTNVVIPNKEEELNKSNIKKSASLIGTLENNSSGGLFAALEDYSGKNEKILKELEKKHKSNKENSEKNKDNEAEVDLPKLK